ncbi:TPA: hypothetical protein SHT56_003210 [Pseudomonas aeruginosa]|nr:hypothetical protein [Pseudomonas aeruginosa]
MKNTIAMFFAFLFSIFSSASFSDDQVQGERVSITNAWSGSIITIYNESSNSWLWGYSKYSVRDYDTKNNWYVLYNSDSTVSFRNEWNGNCIESTSARDIVHNPCSVYNDQKFRLILTTTGAVMLKNDSDGGCLDNQSGSGESFNIHLVDCPSPGSPVDSKLLWVLAAPFSNATVSPNQ